MSKTRFFSLSSLCQKCVLCSEFFLKKSLIFFFALRVKFFPALRAVTNLAGKNNLNNCGNLNNSGNLGNLGNLSKAAFRLCVRNAFFIAPVSSYGSIR